MHREKEVTPMLVFAIFSAALGMFQFGFNTGVINAPQKVLEEFIANVYKTRTGNWISEEVRDVIWSITVSIFAVGGMIGGIVAPLVANWCGRKTGLVLNNTIAVLGITLMSSSQLSHSIECLVIGRFFIGLNCGLNTTLVPMYLSEISTVSMRGAIGTVSQLGATIGLLFSQVLGLRDILGTKELWPFLFGFAFIPAILQLVMLPFCPESPRYLLLSCGRVSEARLALRRLRSSSDIEDDIEEMRAEDRAHQVEVRKYGKLSSIRELACHPWLRLPLLVGIMMQLSQQLSGINAIFYYSTDIFLSAEVPENYAVYATMGVGAIMVLMTLVSISLIDKLGRRTLHLYGLAGMFLASIFLTISLLVKFLYDWMKYISVISILFYALFFGIGPGSIPLLITAELFTQDTRPAAMSASVLFNWFSNFVVGLTFPLMKRVLQSYLFLPFTVFLAIFWIFTYKKLPETKNRTFEEIASIFRPIQLAATPSDGLIDHDLGLYGDQATGPTTTPRTPGDEMNQLSTAHDFNTANSHGNQDKFRFDVVATRGHLEGQRHLGNSMAGLNAYLDQQHSHQQQPSSFTGSQGKLFEYQQQLHHQQQQHQQQLLHHQSHQQLHHQQQQNSCTSIPQNLSTNDQQPLIMDTGGHKSAGQYHLDSSGNRHLSSSCQKRGNGHQYVSKCSPSETRCCSNTTSSFMMDRHQSGAGGKAKGGGCGCCVAGVHLQHQMLATGKSPFASRLSSSEYSQGVRTIRYNHLDDDEDDDDDDDDDDIEVNGNRDFVDDPDEIDVDAEDFEDDDDDDDYDDHDVEAVFDRRDDFASAVSRTKPHNATATAYQLRSQTLRSHHLNSNQKLSLNSNDSDLRHHRSSKNLVADDFYTRTNLTKASDRL